MYYNAFKYVLLGPGLKVYYDPWHEGEENIPEKGGAILASNHLSFSDSVFLPLVIKRKLVFLGKAEYFEGKGVKGWATKAFMEGVGTIPVQRGGGRASEAAIRTGVEVLKGGDLLGLYPEGTRSPDGRLYRGKTGAARMAIEAGVPVIPVAMIGTDKAQPIGQRVPNRAVKVGARIGRAIDLSEFAGRQEDREALRVATTRIMTAIQELSGQEYVDKDAAIVKRSMEKAKGPDGGPAG
jgi:1-acyl-sn-glycerol-3-phosphate acyltransferase